MVIQRSDRIAEVLERDARLTEVFVAASPAFRRLRSPLMRKTMGRLATVEHAARMAGVDPDLLTERLNRALSGDPEPAAPSLEAGESQVTSNTSRAMSSIPSDAPPALASIPPERVVDVDVREDLRNGKEPFSRIMAARREIPPGGVLCLRAIFEPVPLYAVMAKQGFDHWTEELAADDWRVWFYPARAEAEPGVGGAATAVAGTQELPTEDGDEVIVLDVRGMEPPEPMVRTLAALEELPPGRTLLQINERVPQFLLPQLQELGFTYQIREQDDALVRVFIRRRSDA